MSSSHRDLCVVVARWLLSQPWADLVCWELRWNFGGKRGVADVVGCTSSRATVPKIVVCEVKRTRADLLQDLRARKLLKYQEGSSHCYLAGTTEALRLDKQTVAETLEELTEKGLPKSWGVLHIRGDLVVCLRAARSTGSPAPARISMLVRKIAKSYCYRVLGGTIKED